MEYPQRQWTIHLIHHSHTDIGYTDRQERIAFHHAGFIKRALELVREKPGFKWTCEVFWGVERFLESATPEESAALAEAVRKGDIEVSANYLNMTELAGDCLWRRLLSRALDYGKNIGAPVSSAMTADVNGFSWAWAQAMAEAGVDNLFSCVHTHHGMFPSWRKQAPFWWETPKGQRILVWNGEHYQIGNELGMMPGANYCYTIEDELSPDIELRDTMDLAEIRLPRYLRMLESEGYPYDFVPITVHGLVTDNAPPNAAVVDHVSAWNARHGGRISIELTTPTPFFGTLRAHGADIPVRRGDWPDWWSDGVGSTPGHTALFRRAQRDYETVLSLDPGNRIVPASDFVRLEDDLARFAEHTWGFHSSVGEPYHRMVHSLEARKMAYAANAASGASAALDAVRSIRGEAPLRPGRALRYRVVNLSPGQARDTAYLFFDNWEEPVLRNGFRVVDEKSGTALPHQYSETAMGHTACVSLDMCPGEERVLRIEPVPLRNSVTTASCQLAGLDNIQDVSAFPGHPSLNSGNGIRISSSGIDTPFLRLRWEIGKGIVSWQDTVSGRELLDSGAEYGAFTPVYEVSPVADVRRMSTDRRSMGRNRKNPNVRRSTGRLTGFRLLGGGLLNSRVELTYDLPGCVRASLILTAHAGLPRVEVAARFQKETVWDPESLFLALPFRAGIGQILYMDKAGIPVRPWHDQIEGTLTDFTCVQSGLALCAPGFGLVVATPDAPLVQIGPLEYGDRLLKGHPDLPDAPAAIFSWVCNNIWETNFKASCEGFHEFAYHVAWGSDLADGPHALAHCTDMIRGFMAYRI